jgi:threonine dehydrogenase-like Zn-dependent dehydrogenase
MPGALTVRTATVEELADGSLRVSCAAHRPAAVFVDLSPTHRGLWARGYPKSAGVHRTAAEEFLATASRAVAAVQGLPDGSVQVIGEGLLARLAERLLPASFESGRPRAVIEASGAEASVKQALSDVEVLGTVVLAAPFDASPIQVAGYADIHARGLTVVGLPWSTGLTEGPTELVDWALASLANLAPGEAAPAAPWCRLDP